MFEMYHWIGKIMKNVGEVKRDMIYDNWIKIESG